MLRQTCVVCGCPERERTSSWNWRSASPDRSTSPVRAASPDDATRRRPRPQRPVGRDLQGLLTIFGWLTIVGEGPSLQPHLRITSLETTAVRVPLQEPLKWTGGIRESASGLVVELGTDEGLVGIGEAPGPTLPTIQTIIDRELR